MFEFEIGKYEYKATRLTAMQQFHLMRKLSVLMPKLAPILQEYASGNPALTNGDFSTMVLIADKLQPFLDALSALPDAESEYIIGLCAGSVSRKRKEDAAFIQMYKNGNWLVDNIELSDILHIVVRVVHGNLGNFINGLLSTVA